jgi:hypothetical protein
MWSISSEVLVAFRWWPSLAETCKGLILLLKTLLHLMEFNPNFTYKYGKRIWWTEDKEKVFGLLSVLPTLNRHLTNKERRQVTPSPWNDVHCRVTLQPAAVLHKGIETIRPAYWNSKPWETREEAGPRSCQHTVSPKFHSHHCHHCYQHHWYTLILITGGCDTMQPVTLQ